MVEGELQPRARGVYDLMRGVGAHEIIIETPRMVRSLSELTVNELTELLAVWQQRLGDLQNDVRLKYGLLFQNVGARAGGSVYHACSQLIATPVVPTRIQTMLTNAAEWFAYRGRSLFGDIVQQETEAQTRVVLTDAHYLTFCPYASASPFEVALYPRRHRSHFEAVPGHELRALALLLKDVMTRIDRGLSRPPYSVVLYTAPFREPERPDWSWHLTIAPSLSSSGAFPQATGFSINPVAPEEAAEFLRGVPAG
ncbi:MAG: galactose-1-phosphate uridylyltransferase, partial [Planctomycetota bacterium]